MPTSPGPTAPTTLRALLLPLPQARQASVLLGEPGVALPDPDMAALDVLASVLNSFGGRLFDEVRSGQRQGQAHVQQAAWPRARLLQVRLPHV